MSKNKEASLRRYAVGRATDRVKVAVALRVAQPDPACVNRLRALGLTVDRVVGNKLLGSIEAADKADLAADPDVVEVEEGATLSLL